eukprot:scaffold80228_cov68-Phaeocystis_antarctica.AAC.5
MRARGRCGCVGAHCIAVLRDVEHALVPTVEHALVHEGELRQRVIQILSAPSSVGGAKGQRLLQHRSLDRGSCRGEFCLRRSVHLRSGSSRLGHECPGYLRLALSGLGRVLFNGESKFQEGKEHHCADEQAATELNGKLRYHGSRQRAAVGAAQKAVVAKTCKNGC